MAKNITRWSPDTCKCVIDYETDTDKPDDDPIISAVVTACEAHKNLQIGDHLSILLDENRRKNKLLSSIIHNIPSAVEEKVTTQRNTIKKLKPGYQYKWSYNMDRILEVELVGFSTLEKNTIQTLINNRFLNKVIIK